MSNEKFADVYHGTDLTVEVNNETDSVTISCELRDPSWMGGDFEVRIAPRLRYRDARRLAQEILDMIPEGEE